MDDKKKAPKNIVELIYMINKLKPEEFIGICKILGVEIYVEDLSEEKRVLEQVGMLSAAVPSNEGLVVEEEDEESAARSVQITDEPNLRKTPRKAEDMIKDVVDKLLNLNRTQRRNLKKLLKAATKGDK